MHPASNEQRAVVEAAGQYNVIVDSVAGSGKTTTVLHIAKEYSDKKILLLTYNTKLRLETRERCSSNKIYNIDIHTYHSFGYKYVGTDCCTDAGLIRFMKTDDSFNVDDEDFNATYSEEPNVWADEQYDSSPLESHVYESVDAVAGFEEEAYCEGEICKQQGPVNWDDYYNTVNTVSVTADNTVSESAENTEDPNCDNYEVAEDTVIENIEDTKQIGTFAYDMIIIDECQDMTPLLYRYVRRLIDQNRLKYSTRCVIMGDKYQSIYGYAGADSRFITLADTLFAQMGNKEGWTKRILSTSYRITHQMANFVNFALGEQRLKAVKNGTKPYYTVYSPFQSKCVLQEILTLLKTYNPEDIFVLAASIRSQNDKNPVKMLSNQLSNCGIKVYMPNSDDSRIDPDVIKGKIVFSSFHQTKGLERKCVILLGFDAGYFKFYNRNDPHDKCPNILYVALTRATEHLSLYHTSGNPPFDFIDMQSLNRFVHFRGRMVANTSQQPRPDIKAISVTDLLRHVPSDKMYSCMQLITSNVIRPPSRTINLPVKSKQLSDDKPHRYFSEDVSDINGVAVTFCYEYMQTGTITNFENILIAIAGSVNSQDNLAIKPVVDSDDSKVYNTAKLIMLFETTYKLLSTNVINIPEESVQLIKDITAYFKDIETDKTYKLDTDSTRKHIMQLLSVMSMYLFHRSSRSITAENFLKLANVYLMIRNKLVFKMNQITKYDWVDDKDWKKSYDRSCTEFDQYETKEFEFDVTTEFAGKIIHGSIDIMADNTIYEIKTTTELKPEHYLQCALYQYMFNDIAEANLKGLLFNVRTNELIEINTPPENMQKIIKILLCNKFHKQVVLSDEQFCRSLGLDVDPDVVECVECQASMKLF